MNSQFEYLRGVEPVVASLQCGGWLATSPLGVAIRIGVIGISEADARAKFGESLGRWIDILADGDAAASNGSGLQKSVIVHS